MNHPHSDHKGKPGTPVTYLPNEFPPFVMLVPGVGPVVGNGMDAEVIEEIKAAG